METAKKTFVIRAALALVALAAATTLPSVKQAWAQIDPYRQSYGLYDFTLLGDPVLAGEAFREDTDTVSYTEHWVLYPNYLSPDAARGVGIQLVPGLAPYDNTDDFLARVPFAPGSHYAQVHVTTYDAIPATNCVTIERGVLGGAQDALINSGTGTDGSARKNFGASQSLTASLDATGQRDALLQFDLSPIPRTATVVSAKVSLYVLLYGGAPVRAHQVTAPWTESNVTWGSFNGAYAPAVLATFPAATAGQSTSADISDLAQGSISGGVENDGILLERDTGTTVFASSEVAKTTQRPSLTVCYF